MQRAMTDDSEIGRDGETERLRRQRGRNIAIALALAGLAVLFFVVTLARLGENVLNRPM
jgi:hypothetical protein